MDRKNIFIREYVSIISSQFDQGFYEPKQYWHGSTIWVLNQSWLKFKLQYYRCDKSLLYLKPDYKCSLYRRIFRERGTVIQP